MVTHHDKLVKRRNKIAPTALALFGLMVGLQHTAGADTSGAGMPPMPVQIEELSALPLRLWHTFPGRLVAVDYAEIRPQVSGRITAIHFTNGQRVNKGDVLFEIDRRPFLAQLKAAEAARAHAAAQLTRAKTVKSDFVSQSIIEERNALLQAADAALTLAKLNLEYAEVRAPITGIVSRAEITAGNLVEINMGAPLLTSITADNGIYADFVVDEATYLNSASLRAADIPVEVSLSGLATPLSGSLESFDNRVDVATGGVRARARFENAGGLLKPGMFANVRLGSPTQQLLTVSEKAIGTDQDKKFVMVVDAGSRAGFRPVVLGDSSDGRRVVKEGLKAGDKVILSGLQMLRPGMAVAPQAAQIN